MASGPVLRQIGLQIASPFDTGKRHGPAPTAITYSGPVSEIVEFVVPVGLPETGSVRQHRFHGVQHLIRVLPAALLGVDDRVINRAVKRQLAVQQIQQDPGLSLFVPLAYR